MTGGGAGNQPHETEGSDNPLTIDPTDINRIQVLETIKEGQTVYRAQ